MVTAKQKQAAAARQARADKKQQEEDDKRKRIEDAAAVEAGRIAAAGLGESDDEIPDLNTQEELAAELPSSSPEVPAATPRQAAAIPIQMAKDALLQVVKYLDECFGTGLPKSSYIIELVEKGLSKFAPVGSGSLIRFASYGAFEEDRDAPLLRPSSRTEYITYLVDFWFRSRAIGLETRAPAPALIPAVLLQQGGEPDTAGDAGVAAAYPPAGAIGRDAMDEQEDHPMGRRQQAVRVRFLSHPYSCLTALMRS
jgi:hypothetical protein